MGEEWSLGVALLNEVWPVKSRVIVAGLIGGTANLGYMKGAVLSLSMAKFLTSVQSLLLGCGLSELTVASLLANKAGVYYF
jgi:hypothetical protein